MRLLLLLSVLSISALAGACGDGSSTPAGSAGAQPPGSQEMLAGGTGSTPTSAAGDAAGGAESGSSAGAAAGAGSGAAGSGVAGSGASGSGPAQSATDAGAAEARDAGDGDAGGGVTPPAPGEGVRLEGGQLLVDGAPFQIQGVCWNPVPRGGVHPADLDFAGFAAGDAELMQQAGINAVRTYDTITDTSVLDTLYAKGIFVLNMVYAWGGDDPSVVDARVEAVKDHPAILMWVLGNEWNYNGLYVGLSHDAARDALNEAAARIRAIDDAHPIATVYGELPSAQLVEAMPLVDVWGINAYRGISFGSLFDAFADVSDKPMFLAEYGADAYDATQGAPNPTAQADATRALTEEILAHGAALGAGGQCLGGTIFEWADELWKDRNGSPDVQDVGGIAPGGGPYPDQTFNEEWWGVVDVDRNPRPAYDVLAELYAGP